MNDWTMTHPGQDNEEQPMSETTKHTHEWPEQPTFKDLLICLRDAISWMRGNAPIEAVEHHENILRHFENWSQFIQNSGRPGDWANLILQNEALKEAIAKAEGRQ